ncbi:hypothetical protein BV898_17993 [Hypsibius exemplaris]|uniref:Uncharacterized protein n=1 Tax=Hypsibius exemplaris TaxID=2072580 RepID=A0A9X6RN10_HYPEX|nr:hypothetical protein BV898_17993 [Hypsibius exemplaris]
MFQQHIHKCNMGVLFASIFLSVLVSLVTAQACSYRTDGKERKEAKRKQFGIDPISSVYSQLYNMDISHNAVLNARLHSIYPDTKVLLVTGTTLPTQFRDLEEFGWANGGSHNGAVVQIG